MEPQSHRNKSEAPRRGSEGLNTLNRQPKSNREKHPSNHVHQNDDHAVDGDVEGDDDGGGGHGDDDDDDGDDDDLMVGVQVTLHSE